MSLSLARPVKIAALSAAAVLTLAGCNAGSNLDVPEGSDGGQETIVTAYNGAAGAFQRNMNPFSPNSVAMIKGNIYEPLFFFNQLEAIDQEPVAMLGTDYEWNDEGTELTVHTREGVTWTDGQPFSANDVAFTFNLIADTAELNASGEAPRAEALDDTTVVLQFQQPSFASAPAVLGKTYMVPEHVWSEVDNASTFANENPMGTGPFAFDTFTTESYLLRKNDGYWQEGLPKIDGVRVISLSGNQSATDKYLAGEIDFMGGALPNLDQLIADKPDLSYVNTGVMQTSLFTCSNVDLGCTGPQTDAAVRRAIYLGLDREQLSNLAFFGLGTDISPAYALPERDADFIDPSIEVAPWNAQVDEAKAVLEEAGYALNADGLYAKDGVTLTLNALVPSGWTDFITALDTARQQLRAIGVDLVPQQVSVNEWNAAKTTGNFQLVIDSLGQGAAPDPFFVYQTHFHTDNTMPVGENGNPYANVARFSNPEVDAAIDAAGATADMDAKREAYYQIQAIVSEDLPYIPVLIGSTLTEFNNSRATGWPTEDNLYAFPPSWAEPDSAQILMHIEPAN